jgi:hypothetical protein
MCGPACRGLATELRVPLIDLAAAPEREGRMALPAATATDLARVGDRPVHLVVGGAWRHLATVRPAIVSAATDDDLVDAVRVAVAWEVPLGWLGQRDGAVRIDPFVIAAHVRALLAVDPPPTRARSRTAPRRGRDGAAPVEAAR